MQMESIRGRDVKEELRKLRARMANKEHEGKSSIEEDIEEKD